MSRVTLIVLLIAATYVGLCSAIPSCGKNEDFLLCRTKCEPQCPNVMPQSNCLQPEVADPVAGSKLECHLRACQCKRGYMRSKSGVCVLEKDC